MIGKMHPLHEIIGKEIEQNLPSGCVLIKDKACGGDQRIPLFYMQRKSRDTEYCNVDLIVLKENRIRIIIEIEESNVKPTQICGKFLTSALAQYLIHESMNNDHVKMESLLHSFKSWIPQSW